MPPVVVFVVAVVDLVVVCITSNRFGPLLAVLSLEEPVGILLLLIDLEAEPKEHS